MLVAACTAPDGTHWALQSWQRAQPLRGFDALPSRPHGLGAAPRRTGRSRSRSSRSSPTGRTTARCRGSSAATLRGQARLRLQDSDAEGRTERQVRPVPLHRHVQLRLRTGLEARRRERDAYRHRRLLLQLRSAAASSAGLSRVDADACRTQGERHRVTVDGPRRDAGHPVARVRRSAGTTRRPTERSTRSSTRCSRGDNVCKPRERLDDRRDWTSAVRPSGSRSRRALPAPPRSTSTRSTRAPRGPSRQNVDEALDGFRARLRRRPRPRRRACCDPARHAGGLRAPPNRVAEEDALHEPVDDDAAADHREANDALRVDVDVDPVAGARVIERGDRRPRASPVVEADDGAARSARCARPARRRRRRLSRASDASPPRAGRSRRSSTFARPRKRATSASSGRAQSSSGVATWTTRPARMTATRSPSANASVWSCVT